MVSDPIPLTEERSPSFAHACASVRTLARTHGSPPASRPAVGFARTVARDAGGTAVCDHAMRRTQRWITTVRGSELCYWDTHCTKRPGSH